MAPYLIATVALLGFSGAIYFFFVRESGSVFDRAIHLAEKGQFTDARGLVRAKIDSDPDNARAHHVMARIYNIEGNEDSELVHLLELKRINRFSGDISGIEILNRIGEIYYSWGAYRESFENYMDTLSISSGNDMALTYLAFMAIGQGAFDIAENYFKKLVKIAPNVADYHLARGVGLSMLKSSEAMRELDLGLSLNSEDETAQFLVALQGYKQGEPEKARSILVELIPRITEPAISYIASKLATGVFYLIKDYDRALEYGERCLHAAIQEGWAGEEYDSRLSVSYMALLTNNMEKASENLMELEIRNPTDEMVMKVSDFRMDIEEGLTSVDTVSPRGFDFISHLQDWLRKRFPEDAIYKLSGLAMDSQFDVLAFYTKDGTEKERKTKSESFDPMELIQRFNALKGTVFEAACQRLITLLGYKLNKTLPYRDKDGADFLVVSSQDKKVKALLRVRQWKNQPISDIFLRDMQNAMNELKVQEGYVVAGARLTAGAEAALQNLKKINVVNDMEFGELLKKVLN